MLISLKNAVKKYGVRDLRENDEYNFYTGSR